MRLRGCRGSPCHTVALAVSLSDGTPGQIWLSGFDTMQPAGLRTAIYIHTVSQLQGDTVSMGPQHLQDRARKPQPHSFLELGQEFPCLLYLTNTTEGPFYCLKPATTPSLCVLLPTTGSEHSWGSSSSKHHFSLLSSLEQSFENVTWHRQRFLGSRLYSLPGQVAAWALTGWARAVPELARARALSVTNSSFSTLSFL